MPLTLDEVPLTLDEVPLILVEVPLTLVKSYRVVPDQCSYGSSLIWVNTACLYTYNTSICIENASNHANVSISHGMPILYKPVQEKVVLTAFSLNHSLNMHAQPPSGAGCINFGLCINFHPVSSEETAWTRSLARTVAAHICDKFQNLMYWLNDTLYKTHFFCGQITD